MTSQGSAQEAAQATPQGNVQGNAQETTRETPKESSQESSQEGVKEAPQEAAQEASQESSQETSQGTSQEGPQGASSFLAGLKDWNFRRFVAVDFAKVVYMLCIVLGLLAWGMGGLVFLFMIGAQGDLVGFGALLAVLVFGAVLFFLFVIAVRLLIEFIVATIRTSQNSAKILERLDNLERAHLGNNHDEKRS